MNGGGNNTGKQPVQKLTAEAGCQFQSGIELTLSRWPTFRMAIENQCGPHSHLRFQQILIDLYNLFTQSKERIYVDDVENLLDDAMLSLNFELDDGSIEEVAEKLMFMYEDCLEGNFSSIEMLRASNQNVVVPNVAQVVDDSDDDSEDIIDDGNVTSNDSSDMAIDVALPQSTSTTNGHNTSLEPHVEAEDGWSVVSNRRRNRR